MNEYIHTLEERQQLLNDQQEVAVPDPGYIVLLKGGSKQKAPWSSPGKDDIVRGLRLKLGSGHVVERTLQLLCDLEIGGKALTPRWIPNPDEQSLFQREEQDGEQKMLPGARLKMYLRMKKKTFKLCDTRMGEGF